MTTTADILIQLNVESYKVNVPFIGFSSAKPSNQTINIKVEDVTGLTITTKVIKPYVYEFLAIDERFLSSALYSIMKALNRKSIDVIKKLEMVILKGDLKLRIYDHHLSKMLAPILIDADLPNSLEGIIDYYRTKNYMSDVKQARVLSSVSAKDLMAESTFLNRTYIGYTDQDPTSLRDGKELGCEVILYDNRTVEEYIFIAGMKSVSITHYFKIQEFYVMPEDLKEQLRQEFSRIKDKYLGVLKITCAVKLFDYFDVKSLLEGNEFSRTTSVTIPAGERSFAGSLQGYRIEYSWDSKEIKCSPSMEKNTYGRKLNNYSAEYNRPDIKEQQAKDDEKRKWLRDGIFYL